MLYTIRHVTLFRYSHPVRESVMEVRMQPRSETGQRLLSFSLTTEPRSQVFSYEDPMGNTVHHFDVLKDHGDLRIEAQAQVEMATPPRAPDSLPPESWAALSPERLESDVYDMLRPHGHLQPTVALRQFLDAHGIARTGDPLSTLLTLKKTIHDAFDYAPGVTDVDTPIDEVLAHGNGVCQDFSQVMIAAARHLGIPARYVSGYLFHRKEVDDRPAPDATHAWVEAFVPYHGWIGFDPTNNTLARDRHVRVAVGRDYSDVPPTRGTFKGVAESELSYSVSVQLASSPQRLRAELKVARPMSGGASHAQAAAESFRQTHQQQQQQQ